VNVPFSVNTDAPRATFPASGSSVVISFASDCASGFRQPTAITGFWIQSILAWQCGKPSRATTRFDSGTRRRYGEGDIATTEIDKLLALEPSEQPAVYVFLVTCAVIGQDAACGAESAGAEHQVR
jgi:hypothetical protein